MESREVLVPQHLVVLAGDHTDLIDNQLLCRTEERAEEKGSSQWEGRRRARSTKPPAPHSRLTQHGHAEQRQEHQRVRGGPFGKQHGLDPQEAPHEQQVEPGPGPGRGQRSGRDGRELGTPSAPPRHPPRSASPAAGPGAPNSGAVSLHALSARLRAPRHACARIFTTW